eukprot:6195993-Pleurochrysis_carterae.AAC.4
MLKRTSILQAAHSRCDAGIKACRCSRRLPERSRGKQRGAQPSDDHKVLAWARRSAEGCMPVNLRLSCLTRPAPALARLLAFSLRVSAGQLCQFGRTC